MGKKQKLMQGPPKHFIVHRVKLRIVNEPIVLGNPEVHLILFLLVLIGDVKLCSIRHGKKE